EDVPDNVCLAFNSVTAVQNYFWVVSTEATLANQYFDPNVYGTSYSDAGATLYFTREGLGQRPHLLGVNLSALTLAQLQAINGSVAITFNGWNYSANIDLSNATNFSDAAQILQTQLNAQAPVLAQTTGDTIQSQTVFYGRFQERPADGDLRPVRHDGGWGVSRWKWSAALSLLLQQPNHLPAQRPAG